MPNFDKPIQGETLGDYLECRLSAFNMAIQALQRQIDTITAAHNTVVDRLDRMDGTKIHSFLQAHEYYHSFSAAMQAFVDGKEIKRRSWNKWYSAQRCDCIPLYADGVKSNDWQIKE